MKTIERRAILSLSTIMSLRMLGLFMVLPVFTLYAQQLHGATPLLIGAAMGIYGLFQALCQIPFGALSDHIGRKPIIFIGLLIFITGSLMAAFAHSIFWMMIARALQGAGAIGSTALALIADLTTEEQRTKAMAISGMTIGFSFLLAILIGPILTQWLPINNLFLVAALSGCIGIFILYTAVPTPSNPHWHRDTEPELSSFLELLRVPELAKLNSGIFILHAIFTASFIIIPLSLSQFAGLPSNEQWIIYLPTLLIAFVITLMCIGLAERKQQIKFYFIFGIIMLGCAQLLFWIAQEDRLLSALGLCLFFTGFSLLESFLPSLISRTAPVARKGSALGIYSCSQFLGIFVGGMLGGWLYGKFSFSGVYLFCIILSLAWLIIAILMQTPRYLTTQMWLLSPAQQANWEEIATKLRVIPGMIEVTFIAEDRMVYLKMERTAVKNPEFIRLKAETKNET